MKISKINLAEFKISFTFALPLARMIREERNGN